MTLKKFSTREQTLMIQALRDAGHIYAQDSAVCRKEGLGELASQFVRRSIEVFKIADRIEEEEVTK